MNTTPSESLQQQLSQLFGSYKAEWLKEQLFDLFTEPAYFPELATARSCVLIGGRGTGKTTVLRGLSYQGRFALAQRQTHSVPSWQWYGLYYRVNTNHVTAFDGPELRSDQWIPLFAHYFNILLCDLLLEFLEWYEYSTNEALALPPEDCQKVARTLHLPPCKHHREMRTFLDDSRIAYEAYINNVVDAPKPLLSLQAAPIDRLCDAILTLPHFRGKQFFFLLDEYENLLDYQQQVVNTLVKHAGQSYCFKIGVRELGWRCRSTLNPNEQLVHPADYVRIDIGDKLQGDTFKTFAGNVCKERLARISLDERTPTEDLDQLLPGMTEDEEADLLGVEALATAELERLRAVSTNPDDIASLEAMTPLEAYFVRFWADAQKLAFDAVLHQARVDPAGWATRFGNYKHALLYTLRRGKRGIHKYYCGWNTFTQIAAGNIRYVLELVDQTLLAHFNETGSLPDRVSPALQTQVAQKVGGMNLSELEGLSVDGGSLTKLLLSLGRVFQVMAADAAGHAPEVNQFELVADNGAIGGDPDEKSVERLLNAAVMHLALLRTPGNKPGDVGDTKDYDYMVHPIYSPFFEFSPRRKRKMALAPTTILGLISKPKETIRTVLKAQNRSLNENLPEQLTLFERFYDADP